MTALTIRYRYDSRYPAANGTYRREKVTAGMLAPEAGAEGGMGWRRDNARR